MPIDEFKIDPNVKGQDWRAWEKPFAIVDVGEIGPEPAESPPFPVLGVGAVGGVAPDFVDAIVEPPITLERLIRSISANPNAASVVTGLLRAIPHTPDREALLMESLAFAVLQASDEHAAWLKRRAADGDALAPGALDLARDGDVLEVALNRPHANNAIDRPMRDALTEAFELATLDDSIRTVRLRAVGKAFSIGADLSEFGTTRDPATAHVIRSKTLPAHWLSMIRDKLEVHISGACVGSGLEMAAFARRLTASRQAWFQLPELAMGIIPGAGGCVSVTRRIGRHRTALMVLSGARIGAETALSCGLIDAIVDD